MLQIVSRARSGICRLMTRVLAVAIVLLLLAYIELGMRFKTFRAQVESNKASVDRMIAEFRKGINR